MQFFEGKDFCFATNSKAGKHSICKAIVEKDYPDKLWGLVDVEELTYYTLTPQTDTPTKPVLMLVRDPMERFISAASMNHGHIDIEDALAGMGSEPYERQVDYVKSAKEAGQEIKLFKFPTHLKAFCKAAGFTGLDILNRATAEPKILTPEQEDLVRVFYADDIELFNSIG